jgi:RNA polymerase sigma-70 factor (ECF subfamily)
MRGDPELVARIATGDVDALAELYDRHVTTLLPVALRILRDRVETEDVLHDAFVAVRERASQYVEARGTVLAWMATLVRNLAIDRLRRRKRRNTIAHDVLAREPPPPNPTPERLTAEAVERERLRRAMADLPELQRLTLEIAFFEGLTYAEIAERENVPIGTVKSRAARALMALREALEDEAPRSETRA